MEPYDMATLQLQVVKVKEPTTVSNGKQKQEVIITDNREDNTYPVGTSHWHPDRKQVLYIS